MSFIGKFIEEYVLPEKGAFPISYPTDNVLVAEDLIDIFSNPKIDRDFKTVHHFLGGTILEFEVLIDDIPRTIAIFFDKKVFEFDLKVDEEYHPLFYSQPGEPYFDELNQLANNAVNNLF